MKKIKTLRGRGIPLRGSDVDTDRIIPARFMKCVTFAELGQYLFYDSRFNEDGSAKNHPLNDERYKGGNILIVNRNFGCGSSREHAPQSIVRYGIQAVIGESFAEIFADNSTAIGIPLLAASKADIENLLSFVEEDPQCEIKIDLEKQEINYGDFAISIQQPEQMKKALTEGTWNSTAELLSDTALIKSVAEKIPYVKRFAE